MKRRGPVKSIVGLVFQVSIDLFRFCRTYEHQLYSVRRSQSPLKKSKFLVRVGILGGADQCVCDYDKEVPLKMGGCCPFILDFVKNIIVLDPTWHNIFEFAVPTAHYTYIVS